MLNPFSDMPFITLPSSSQLLTVSQLLSLGVNLKAGQISRERERESRYIQVHMLSLFQRINLVQYIRTQVPPLWPWSDRLQSGRVKALAFPTPLLWRWLKLSVQRALVPGNWLLLMRLQWWVIKEGDLRYSPPVCSTSLICKKVREPHCRWGWGSKNWFHLSYNLDHNWGYCITPAVPGTFSFLLSQMRMWLMDTYSVERWSST